MRRSGLQLVVVSSVLCFGFTASAQPVTKESLDNCRSYSNVAAAIMEKRQEGASMADMMDALSGIEVQPDLAQLMVRMAYEEPLHQSREGKSRAVSQFRDGVYKRCFDSHGAKEKGL